MISDGSSKSGKGVGVLLKLRAGGGEGVGRGAPLQSVMLFGFQTSAAIYCVPLEKGEVAMGACWASNLMLWGRVETRRQGRGWG